MGLEKGSGAQIGRCSVILQFWQDPLMIQSKACVQCTPVTVLIPNEVALGHWSIILHYLWRGLPLWVFTHQTDTSTLHTKQIINPQQCVILWAHRHVTTHCVCRIWCRVFTSCLLPVYFRSPCEDFLAKVDLAFFRSQFTDLRWHRSSSKLGFLNILF